VRGFLLDTNVLIALVWPSHSAHLRAQHWFAKNATQGWATCPMTQCGFVRVSSNPAFSPQAPSSAEALALLRANLNHPAHSFWPDDLDLRPTSNFAAEHLTGHQQVTDAYLLSLAIRHQGKLATLDRGIAAWGEPGGRFVELIG